MSAGSELIALVRKLINSDVVYARALKFARAHHMGVDSMKKLRSETFGEDSKGSMPDNVTVAHLVDDLVRQTKLASTRLAATQDEGDMDTPDNQPQPVRNNGKDTQPEVDPIQRCSPSSTPSRTDEAAILPDAKNTVAGNNEDRTSDPWGTPSTTSETNITDVETTDIRGSRSDLVLTTDIGLHVLPDLVNGFKDLQKSFAQFVTESTDREVRYIRKLNELTTKVHFLESSLQTVRQEASQAEQRLLKKLGDVTSRIGNTTKPQNRPDHLVQAVNNAAPEYLPTQTDTMTTSCTDGPQITTTDPTPLQINTAPMETMAEKTAEWNCVTSRKQEKTKKNPAAHSTKPNQLPQPTDTSTNNRDQKDKTQRTTLSGATPLRRAVFYLRGLSPDSTTEMITNYCTERNIRVSSCRLIPSRRYGITAARLSVVDNDADREGLLKPDFWPTHIVVRPWSFQTQEPSPAPASRSLQANRSA